MQTLGSENNSLIKCYSNKTAQQFRVKHFYVIEKKSYQQETKLSDHKNNLYTPASLTVIMAYNVPAVYNIINESLKGTQYCSFNLK